MPYKNKSDRNKMIRRRLERRKRLAVEYKGGKCSICGYDKCIAALEFHHIEPSEKMFGVAELATRSWERTKAELDKCIIVCANCHREIEYRT